MLHLSRSCGCGLVVKSRLCRRSVPGSKPDSTEDSPSMWICFPLNQTLWVKRPPAGVFQNLRTSRRDTLIGLLSNELSAANEVFTMPLLLLQCFMHRMTGEPVLLSPQNGSRMDNTFPKMLSSWTNWTRTIRPYLLSSNRIESLEWRPPTTMGHIIVSGDALNES
ncbi:hypothetical protein AVEN_15728-1 [Araneus ventricosus]|uniref:Uncharacterized protein n=1 Tax=Araneus ventricosus TaxID=182803 RepID=A0A4Y2U8Y4_ARAVE|nr:hypothetical protein AVEN_73550-1 [Araneus ventricosus]GBO08029.1 hypothetical protein AVEN_15728-1 [Araneus ventricosus]